MLLWAARDLAFYAHASCRASDSSLVPSWRPWFSAFRICGGWIGSSGTRSLTQRPSGRPVERSQGWPENRRSQGSHQGSRRGSHRRRRPQERGKGRQGGRQDQGRCRLREGQAHRQRLTDHLAPHEACRWEPPPPSGGGSRRRPIRPAAISSSVLLPTLRNPRRLRYSMRHRRVESPDHGRGARSRSAGVQLRGRPGAIPLSSSTGSGRFQLLDDAVVPFGNHRLPDGQGCDRAPPPTHEDAAWRVRGGTLDQGSVSQFDCRTRKCPGRAGTSALSPLPPTERPTTCRLASSSSTRAQTTTGYVPSVVCIFAPCRAGAI